MRGFAAIQVSLGTLLGVFSFVVALAAPCAADFVPGRLYVVENIVEGCAPSRPRPRILEIDPTTGQARAFAEIPIGFCGVQVGLAFTPDGSRLRIGEYFGSRVLEMDGNGNLSTALGASDGVRGPSGSNGMAFNAAGDFFLVNTIPDTHIRMFPAGGGASTVFADATDGIRRDNALATAPDGSVYYLNPGFGDGELLRFSSDGARTVIASALTTLELGSLAIDDRGDIYAWLANGIVRFRAGQTGPGERIASLEFFAFAVSMAFSPLDGLLYLVPEDANQIHSLDRETGALQLVVTQPFSERGFLGWGAAVFVPEPNSLCLMFLTFVAYRNRSRHRVEMTHFSKGIP